jgi:DNA-binding NarL/FixJ family response regulator
MPMPASAPDKIRIALYTQQPFIARGLAAALEADASLALVVCRDTLAGIIESLGSVQADVLVVYVTSGFSLADLREIRTADRDCQIVLWGQELGGEFAYQAMQLGIRGILPDTLGIDGFLTALQDVHRGVLCFERDFMENVLAQKRITLTAREGQLVALVAQGLKNKEIAFQLGITEGTVKVYLFKLFKKLGVNDRLDLALYGLRNLFSGNGPDREPGPSGDTAAAVPRSLMMVARRPAATPLVH